ncbi:MAG: HAD hydrolase-like protein [Defluviitaleaceae bacterium]|nr:HAD hydrolase-like protein [Defluviitaleaceae bacterium]
MPIRTILWDFNGTILDDTAICLRTINDMLGRRGISPVTMEKYLEIMDFPVIRMYEKAGFDLVRESFSQIVAPEYIAAYQPASYSAPLRPGALERIKEFTALGVRQVLLSASRLDLLLEQTGAMGLTPLFEAILGLDDIYAVSKTDLARKWMAGNGANAGETLVIGDTTHDYQVAQELGCRCLLVCGGHNGRRRLLETGAAVAEDFYGEGFDKVLFGVPNGK